MYHQNTIVNIFNVLSFKPFNYQQSVLVGIVARHTSDHGLKTSPTEGKCKVLASSSLSTFYIKRVGKLRLPYPLLSQSVCPQT